MKFHEGDTAWSLILRIITLSTTLNSNPQSLYWPTRRCPSLPCPPLTNLQPHGSSWLLRAPQVGFCLQTLPPIFCLGLLPWTLCCPRATQISAQVPSLSDSPALTIPSIAPLIDYFLRVTHHIWNVQPISGFLVCCWTLASVGAPPQGRWRLC